MIDDCHACQWLEDNQDARQFYLYIDLFDPHEPWDAPKKYVDLYDPGYAGDRYLYPHYGFWREYFDDGEMQHIRAEYMAEASMVDHWFGVLLDKLDELGMAEDTAVIFTSDHGYLLGEHDIHGKSLRPVAEDGSMLYEAIPMYNEIRRVPLLIRLPGQSQGQHLSALVQSPDLMPTILELAGLVSTEVIQGQAQSKALQCGVFYMSDWQFDPTAIHGKSLLPLMRGEVARVRDIAVASSTLINHTPILAKCAIVTEDGWCLHYAGSYDEIDRNAKLWITKLIHPEASRISTAPALYHLPTDPGEAHDVLDANTHLAGEIHARYVNWLEEVAAPAEHIAGRRRLR